MTPLIEFEDVTKRFASVLANDRVSFSILPGARHGIIGENGAGKSTIMKILAGLYLPDSGEIRYQGKPAIHRTPLEASQHGIGMVHQHFMLVPTLTGLENVVLGQEPSLGALDKNAISKSLIDLKKQFGFTVDLNVPVEMLSVGGQQQVELLKVLYRKAETLILDEPTAVLTPQEVDALFERLNAFQTAGRTTILITHKLREILAFTDHVTVMRQGKIVTTTPTQGMTEKSLSELMMGHERRRLPKQRKAALTEVALRVSDLNTQETAHRTTLKGINLNVHRSEIVGIAGIEGNGQSELIDCLLGLFPYSGSIRIKEKDQASQSAYEWRQDGLSLLPPDRHREGLVLPFSLTENTLLGHDRESRFGHPWRLSWAKARAVCEGLLESFSVVPKNPDLPASALSGGNQQKLVVAKETSLHTDLLIAAHPTRGVDIGAIDFIHHHFLHLKDLGAGILLISSEIDELLALSDRILVMYEGKLVGETKTSEANVTQIGLWMAGCA